MAAGPGVVVGGRHRRRWRLDSLMKCEVMGLCHLQQDLFHPQPGSPRGTVTDTAESVSLLYDQDVWSHPMLDFLQLGAL
jgi:hypothetical protein